MSKTVLLSFFFFNDPATTEIYTLSLHDALPIPVNHAAIDRILAVQKMVVREIDEELAVGAVGVLTDRKSTRLNSSHTVISYAVFCLKKKKVYKFFHPSP